MKQDKFLIGILAGIAVLVAAALMIFFLRQESVVYGPEDTPEGVIHNYVLALEKGDYNRAYGYLADLDYRPTFTVYRQAFLRRQLNLSGVSLQSGPVRLEGEEALIEITILRSNRGPFSEIYRDPGTGTLVRQAGQWKISYLPYPYFDWNWFQPPVKDDKPVS